MDRILHYYKQAVELGSEIIDTTEIKNVQRNLILNNCHQGVGGCRPINRSQYHLSPPLLLAYTVFHQIAETFTA